jgi:hypothetical protein
MKWPDEQTLIFLKGRLKSVYTKFKLKFNIEPVIGSELMTSSTRFELSFSRPLRLSD